mmetsp:Transcript_51633/g.109716  ORF Transcript_51633/g.109716 Transcript_51633/m.109716 type:complete len:246 (+) Transcript_51633:400-1137(+)
MRLPQVLRLLLRWVGLGRCLLGLLELQVKYRHHCFVLSSTFELLPSHFAAPLQTVSSHQALPLWLRGSRPLCRHCPESPRRCRRRPCDTYAYPSWPFLCCRVHPSRRLRSFARLRCHPRCCSSQVGHKQNRRKGKSHCGPHSAGAAAASPRDQILWSQHHRGPKRSHRDQLPLPAQELDDRRSSQGIHHTILVVPSNAILLHLFHARDKPRVQLHNDPGFRSAPPGLPPSPQRALRSVRPETVCP